MLREPLRRLVSGYDSESCPTSALDDVRFPTTRHVVESGCERCPKLVDARECISWGTGPLDASVLVVGEAPGYGNPDADRWRGGNWSGMAYTSRHSGRRIRRLLADLGYAEDAYYTNAVKCYPADPMDETGTTNREPTPDERSNCRGHLLTEIERVGPVVILATGKHATTTVLETEGRELDGFLDSVLDPVRMESFDSWLVPILHPSYQDVWIGRLGYEPEEYRQAIRSQLDALVRVE